MLSAHKLNAKQKKTYNKIEVASLKKKSILACFHLENH